MSKMSTVKRLEKSKMADMVATDDLVESATSGMSKYDRPKASALTELSTDNGTQFIVPSASLRSLKNVLVLEKVQLCLL